MISNPKPFKMKHLSRIFVFLGVILCGVPAENVGPNPADDTESLQHDSNIDPRSLTYQRTMNQWSEPDEIEQAFRQAQEILSKPSKPYKLARAKPSRVPKMPYTQVIDPFFIPVPVPVQNYVPPTEALQFQTDPTKRLLTPELIEDPNAFPKVEIINKIPGNMPETQGDPLENMYSPVSEVTYVIPMDEELKILPPAMESQFGETVQPQGFLPEGAIPAAEPLAPLVPVSSFERQRNSGPGLPLPRPFPIQEFNPPPQYRGYYEVMKQPKSTQDRSSTHEAVQSLQSLSSSVLRKITQEPSNQTGRSKVSTIPVSRLAQRPMEPVPFVQKAQPVSSIVPANFEPKMSPEIITAANPRSSSVSEGSDQSQEQEAPQTAASLPSVVPKKSAEFSEEKEESTSVSEQEPLKSVPVSAEISAKIPAGKMSTSENLSDGLAKFAAPLSPPTASSLPILKESASLSPAVPAAKIQSTSPSVLQLANPQAVAQAAIQSGTPGGMSQPSYRYPLPAGLSESPGDEANPEPFRVPGTNLTIYPAGYHFAPGYLEKAVQYKGPANFEIIPQSGAQGPPPPPDYLPEMRSNVPGVARVPGDQIPVSGAQYPPPPPATLLKSSSNMTSSVKVSAPMPASGTQFAPPPPGFAPKTSSDMTGSPKVSSPVQVSGSQYPPPPPNFIPRMRISDSNGVSYIPAPVPGLPYPAPAPNYLPKTGPVGSDSTSIPHASVSASGLPYPAPSPNYLPKTGPVGSDSASIPYAPTSASGLPYPAPSPNYLPKTGPVVSDSARIPFAPISASGLPYPAPSPNYLPKMSAVIPDSNNIPYASTQNTGPGVPLPSPYYMLKSSPNFTNSAGMAPNPYAVSGQQYPLPSPHYLPKQDYNTVARVPNSPFPILGQQFFQPSPYFMPKPGSDFTNLARLPEGPVSASGLPYPLPSPNFMPKPYSNLTDSISTSAPISAPQFPLSSPYYLPEINSKLADPAMFPNPILRPQTPPQAYLPKMGSDFRNIDGLRYGPITTFGPQNSLAPPNAPKSSFNDVSQKGAPTFFDPTSMSEASERLSYGKITPQTFGNPPQFGSKFMSNPDQRSESLSYNNYPHVAGFDRSGMSPPAFGYDGYSRPLESNFDNFQDAHFSSDNFRSIPEDPTLNSYSKYPVMPPKSFEKLLFDEQCAANDVCPSNFKQVGRNDFQPQNQKNADYFPHQNEESRYSYGPPSDYMRPASNMPLRAGPLSSSIAQEIQKNYKSATPLKEQKLVPEGNFLEKNPFSASSDAGKSGYDTNQRGFGQPEYPMSSNFGPKTEFERNQPLNLPLESIRTVSTAQNAMFSPSNNLAYENRPENYQYHDKTLYPPDFFTPDKKGFFPGVGPKLALSSDKNSDFAQRGINTYESQNPPHDQFGYDFPQKGRNVEQNFVNPGFESRTGSSTQNSMLAPVNSLGHESYSKDPQNVYKTDTGIENQQGLQYRANSPQMAYSAFNPRMNGAFNQEFSNYRSNYPMASDYVLPKGQQNFLESPLDSRMVPAAQGPISSPLGYFGHDSSLNIPQNSGPRANYFPVSYQQEPFYKTNYPESSRPQASRPVGTDPTNLINSGMSVHAPQ